MKNIPKKIYLNLDHEPKEGDDFRGRKPITWSTYPYRPYDIEYILATPALKAAYDERQRQIEKEGYDEKHDDEHVSGELALAASHYACPKDCREAAITIDGVGWMQEQDYPYLWPWSPEDWKPTPDDRKREITKAMALLIAEYERLERLEETK